LASPLGIRRDYRRAELARNVLHEQVPRPRDQRGTVRPTARDAGGVAA
jgi:hypothetical protein